MDKLISVQDKLCTLLSSDPDYIIDKCGNILSMNEFREVQKQISAFDKIKVLLKIIIQKDKDTCQCFFDILRQHEAHYQQLQQLFNSTEGSPTPTMVADSNSIVNADQLTNVKAKSLNITSETVSDPRTQKTGNAVGQAPQADYTACDGSIINARKLSGVTVEGALNITSSVKSPSVHAGTVDETLLSSQGPAVKKIIKHKVELIDCLRADHSFILQHVHARLIITDRQYQNLKHISQPEETVTNLIDQVIVKGQESCSLFLELLKQPDVLRTYPQLKQISNKWC